MVLKELSRIFRWMIVLETTDLTCLIFSDGAGKEYVNYLIAKLV